MNNKVLAFMLLIVFCIMGCTSKDRNENSLKGETIELQFPSSLLLQATLPEEYPERLMRYAVDWKDVDIDAAIHTLLSGQPQEHYDYAEGDGYRYIDDHHTNQLLNMYNKDIHGGCVFLIEEAMRKCEDLQEVSRSEQPNYNQQVMGNRLFFDYSSSKELEFASKKEISEEIESTMMKLGYGEVEITVLARDAATANQNREIYNRICDQMGREENAIDDPFTEEDEDYYIGMREVIGDIPVVEGGWYTERLEGISTQASMYALYNKKYGLTDLSIFHYFQIVSEIDDLDIISPDQALLAYIDFYNKSIHLTDTSITRIELNYVILADGEGLYIRPCWMIYTETKTENYIPSTEEFAYEYDVYAVSADTGELLSGNEIPR